NGIANDKLLEIWLSRMDNEDLGGNAVLRLLLTILDDNRAASEQKISADVAATTLARWQRFIVDHREALQAGRRFKLSDPEIAADLFPPGFQFYRDGKPWPPGNVPKQD